MKGKVRVQPKYEQLKQEIKSWLQNGKLTPGAQMPSENEIAEQYGMSRQTVRQALGDLEQEGWLYRVQGKGTFVSEPAPTPPTPSSLQTVGIITTYISDYIFPHIVRGAEAILRSRGYSLLLSSTDNDKDKERESLSMMMGQPLSGLIVEPTKSAEGNPNLEFYLSLELKGIPFLMINERYPELSCPVMRVDDEAGGYEAVQYLIGLGHKRIAGFFKTDDLQGVKRLKGFIRAHQEERIPLQPELVVHYRTEEKEEKPFQAALSMLARPQDERPTAFVCYNDELAVRLLHATRQLGLSVPGDLSLIGFDDSSLATTTEVQLTSMTHPKLEMGADAAEYLLALIENRPVPHPEGKLYAPELIIRESAGRLE